MQLIFGDKKSIEERDRLIAENTIAELKKKIVCPFCGAIASDCYDYDLEEDRFSFNFYCNDKCPNSIEYGEENGFEEAQTTCNSKGVFYKD